MKIYKERKTHNSLDTFRLKKVKVPINGRLEAAHKIIMETSLLIMEKSWNNHGILILNFCGNPEIRCEPSCEKNGLRDFRIGLTQTGL